MTAGDGAECLDIVRQVRPDIVTLDVVMPRLDGWRTAARLRADPRTTQLPIVIVIFNNKKYAAMRQGHVHHYPDGASVSKDLHYGVTIDGPDYEQLGSHFGFHGRRVEKAAELNDAVKAALAAVKDGRTAILNAWITR